METIGVVGAGLMGSEIALVFAMAGHPVLLTDRTDETLAKALDRLRQILAKGVARGFYSGDEAEQTLTRIETTVAVGRYASCGFLTEPVSEDLQVKNDVLGTLDRICDPTCVIATNPSTIPIST